MKHWTNCHFGSEHTLLAVVKEYWWAKSPKQRKQGNRRLFLSPVLRLHMYQHLVMGTHKDICNLRMRTAESFYQSFSSEASYPWPHPAGPGFVSLSTLCEALALRFVKSPLARRFLEVRDSVSSVFLAVIFLSVTDCSNS